MQARETLKVMPGAVGSAIKSDPKEIVELPAKSIDYDLTEIANTGYGARKVEERVIKKVRIDMGWSFIRKKKTGDDEEEEEAENPDMDLNCAFYDAKGEEIQVHACPGLLHGLRGPLC